MNHSISRTINHSISQTLFNIPDHELLYILLPLQQIDLQDVCTNRAAGWSLRYLTERINRWDAVYGRRSLAVTYGLSAGIRAAGSCVTPPGSATDQDAVIRISTLLLFACRAYVYTWRGLLPQALSTPFFSLCIQPVGGLCMWGAYFAQCIEASCKFALAFSLDSYSEHSVRILAANICVTSDLPGAGAKRWKDLPSSYTSVKTKFKAFSTTF